MTQLSLFDDSMPEVLARKTDPPSSKIAAREFDQRRDKVKRAFLTALADLGGGPCTAREVAERAKAMGLHKEAESVRKRASELEEAGLIRCQELQRCKHTGRPAEGWKLT